ncbi:ferrous iron transport protein A [Planctomycetota bacterium]
MSMQLSETAAGSKVKIARVDAGRGLTARLAAMGIIPGTNITVAVNDRKGPIVVMVKDSKIALGRGMVEKILVQ